MAISNRNIVRAPQKRHLGGQDARPASGPVPLDFDGEFTFTSWAGSIIRLVLESGTCFSHFLAKTLHLQRSEGHPAPAALFPLPAPFEAPIAAISCKRGGVGRGPYGMKQALHTLVMALNFVHAGCRHVPTDVLRRPPGPLHKSVFKRLGGFLRACCRQGGSISFCAGRRGAHLVARQNELIDFLAASGFGAGSYEGPGPTRDANPRVPHSDAGPDSLRPYQALRADTVVLHGEANWDISPYLGPDMLLAFKEPAVLETFGGTGGPSPSFEQEDPEELLKLMLVWDSKSLLRLRPGPVDRKRCSRVFGSCKSPGKFRQIGDRRGQNSFEAKLDGVSHELPQGFLLSRLWLPRYTHQLIGSSTDRKDFYTQCGVTLERSFTNPFSGLAVSSGPVPLNTTALGSSSLRLPSPTFPRAPSLPRLGLLSWTWRLLSTVASLPCFRVTLVEWNWRRQRMRVSWSKKESSPLPSMVGFLLSTLSVVRAPGPGSLSTTFSASPQSSCAARLGPPRIPNESSGVPNEGMPEKVYGGPTTRTSSGPRSLPSPAPNATLPRRV